MTAAAATRVWGANDKINVAIVGLGGRGTNHLNIYSRLPDARVAALCDVNQAAREKSQATLLAEFSQNMAKLVTERDIECRYVRDHRRFWLKSFAQLGYLGIEVAKRHPDSREPDRAVLPCDPDETVEAAKIER